MGVRANLRIIVKPVHFRDLIQSLLMGFSSPESSKKFKEKKDLHFRLVLYVQV